MEMYLAIAGVLVVLVLVILGATRRKQITTIIKSEADDYISKKTNTIKVANSKLKDLKESAKVAAEKAGKLYAHEKKQRKQLEELNEKSARFLKDAKKHKANDDKDAALKSLALKKEVDKQVKIVTENIETLESRRNILEVNIEKIKAFIAKHKIQMSGLEARQATNSLLKDMHVGTLDSDTLEETLDNVEDKIETEELEIEYATKEDILKEDETDEDLEKSFEDL